jgi:hypothetical protein
MPGSSEAYEWVVALQTVFDFREAESLRAQQLNF